MATRAPNRSGTKDAAPTTPGGVVAPRPRLRDRAPMLTFLWRRLISSIVVLIGSTFIVYLLLAYSIDPLEELRTSTAPNREFLIQARIDALNLDTPAPIRYLLWLRGVAGCVVGQCDLGSSARTGQDVGAMLAVAIPSTLMLITASTFLAIILGVVIGLTSALRQYTGFDYGVTFMSFVLYSLPPFWVAVLLKLWGAIGFNDFLADPTISTPAVLGIAAGSGFLWQAVVAGSLRRRLTTAVIAFAATAGVLFFISATLWLRDPSLGPVLIGLLGAGAAVAVTTLTFGLKDRRALYSALAVAGVGVALWYPLQFLFPFATIWMVLGLGVLTLVVGGGVAAAFGGPDRRQLARNGAIVGVVVGALIFVDRVMGVWQVYTNSSRINNRPIATIGAQTPGLGGDFWVRSLDTFTHLLLPTIALVLISFALYTRYSRASLLEVMNQDYIRTARAKGLPERVVVVRHAFRNALIPLATIVPLDIASLFGGAIITERIFAWSGMGTLFVVALGEADANPVMGYFLVVGTTLVIANVLVDFLYAALDPRIRVNA